MRINRLLVLMAVRIMYKAATTKGIFMKSLIVLALLTYANISFADTIECFDSQTGVSKLVIQQEWELPKLSTTDRELEGFRAKFWIGGVSLGEQWSTARWQGVSIQYDAKLGNVYYNITAMSDGEFTGYYQDSQSSGLNMTLLKCEYRDN